MTAFRRKAELEEIAEFIAHHGATQCRPAFVGTVNGVPPLQEERQRIAALEVESNWSRAETLARIRRQMWYR
jgi:hypothetical protein